MFFRVFRTVSHAGALGVLAQLEHNLADPVSGV
jgi:hypothetical protein